MSVWVWMNFESLIPLIYVFRHVHPDKMEKLTNLCHFLNFVFFFLIMRLHLEILYKFMG